MRPLPHPFSLFHSADNIGTLHRHDITLVVPPRMDPERVRRTRDFGLAPSHCNGANACKGKGACKTASNTCKGQNACKGKGFLEMTKAECDKIQGASFSLDEAVKPKT